MTGSDLFIRSFRGDVGPTIQRDESVDRFQIYRGKLDQSSLQSLLPFCEAKWHGIPAPCEPSKF